MGDVSGWELGATYVTRSSPRIQDTVLSAVTPHVEWSGRWGRHVPTGWPQEQVAVRRRELDHGCGNPACTDQVVTHSTPFDPTDWERAGPGSGAAHVATGECAAPGGVGPGRGRELLADIVRKGRKAGVRVMPDVPPAWASIGTVPGDGAR